MQFLANKSLYLRNSTRYDQGFYDGLIGSHIFTFNWHQGRCYKFKFFWNFALLCIFG